MEKHYLQRLLDELRVNGTEFAKSLGTSQERINRVLNFKNGISADLARTIIATYKDVNFEWLRTGEGEMITNTQTIEKVSGNGIVGNNVNGGEINDSSIIAGLMRTIEKRDEQMDKREEQIDRLLSIIEQLNNK